MSARIRIVRADQRSTDTPQTPGLLREVAFDGRNPDARTLSGFLSSVRPGAATGAHHHGDQETILHVLNGRARFRWGDRLDSVAEADEATNWVVVRSAPDPIVVNLPELDDVAEPPARDYTPAE